MTNIGEEQHRGDINQMCAWIFVKVFIDHLKQDHFKKKNSRKTFHPFTDLSQLLRK